MSTAFKTLYDAQGFVVVPSLIPPSLFDDLRVAAERAIARTRSGQWAHRRTVGRQFPPFDESNPDSWGVQHVMHPALDEPVFARWYTSDELTKTVAELLACEQEDLQMGEFSFHARPGPLADRRGNYTRTELFNMLINPETHDFALRWHRDDVREDATEEQEQEALALWHHGVSVKEPSLLGMRNLTNLMFTDAMEHVRISMYSFACLLT